MAGTECQQRSRLLPGPFRPRWESYLPEAHGRQTPGLGKGLSPANPCAYHPCSVLSRRDLTQPGRPRERRHRQQRGSRGGAARVSPLQSKRVAASPRIRPRAGTRVADRAQPGATIPNRGRGARSSSFPSDPNRPLPCPVSPRSPTLTTRPLPS